MSAAPATDRAPLFAPAALILAQAGLPVFPCNHEKKPLTEHGFLDATTNAAVIRAWGRLFPHALVAVAIPGGFVVVDIDGPEGWAALEAEGVTLPATLTAITGRGEWHRHLWYALPEGVTIGCIRGLLPNVDTRARGGYVIVPPSRSVFGTYAWVDGFDLARVAPAPAWLLERCAPARPAGTARPADEWVLMLRGPVPEGHRHETLLRVAGLLLRRHDATVAVELARAWAEARLKPTLPEGEVARMLMGALRLEQQRLARAARGDR
jgi:Bifunctional DNA primase/polymerase, N-terminal